MHWHVATCGCSLKADEAAHIDVNDDGKCDVCPWVSSIEVALVIGSAEASKNQVAGGTVTQEGPYSASRVTYVYGSDYVYIKSDTRYTEYDSLYNVVGYYWETDSEEWYTVIDGELLALQDNYAGFHKNDWPEAGYMNGPYLNLVQYSVNVYGVENALIALYNLAVETEGDDLAVTYDYTSNTWTFSFNYIDGYEDWWSGEYTVSTVGVVNVSFIVDAQGVIDYVKIEERYYDSYEQTEDGVWVGIASDDDNIYTTVINQVLGGRVTSFPFNMDDFYVTDIKFIDSEGKELGDELTTDIGVYNEFTVTVVAPESANLSIDVPEVTVYDAYGNVTYNARAGYSSWDGTVFYFTVYREGTYTVEFKTAKTTKTVTVTAVVPAPTYIEPSVVGKDDWGDNTFIVTSTVTGYVGKPVYFMASANEYADASYTVMLSRPALMAGCTVGTETVEVSYTLYEVSAFLAQYPGSYEVLLTSAVDPSLTAVLTIEIVEPPKPSDILNGSYADTWRMNSLVFTPAFEGATEGTVEAVVAPDYWTSYSIVYSYVYNNDGTITLTYVSGDLADVSIVINDDYTVSLGVYNEWWMEYSYTTLEKIETSGSGADVVDGYWYDEGYSYGIIAFFDSETSTGSFTYGDSVLAFTFSVEEVYGVYYITFTEDAANHVNPETLQGLLDFDVMNGNNAWYQPSVYNPYSEYLEIMYVHPMNGYLSTMYFVAA